MKIYAMLVAFLTTAVAPLWALANAGDNGRVAVAVELKLQNTAELDALIAEQTDPASPLYGRFLTPAQFGDRYAPRAADYAATVATLEHAGLRVDRRYDSRLLVDVSAPPATIEHVFHVHLHQVGAGRARQYIADQRPTAGPSLPVVAAIVGVDANAIQPLVSGARPGPAQAPAGGSAVGPDNGYAPIAVTHGFDYPLEHGFNAAGTHIADISDGAPDGGLGEFLQYFKIAASAPTPTIIPVNGTGFDVVLADASVEWLYATAPGAAVLEYEIPTFANINVVDALAKVTSDNIADVVNISFGACELNTTLAFALLPIIKQAAAQGITFASVAFGGAAVCGIPGVALTQTPADSADGLAVSGNNVVEDASNSIVGTSGYVGAGGGVSLLVPLPPWQKGVAGVAPGGRNVPDLALSGEINGAGASYKISGIWIGGSPYDNSPATSGLLAEFVQMRHHRLGAFGRTLYALFGKTGYGPVFADIAYGCNGFVSGLPVCAKPGYDLTSGIGSVDAFRLGLLLP